MTNDEWQNDCDPDYTRARHDRAGGHSSFVIPHLDPKPMPATTASLIPCPVWCGGEWRDLSGVATTPVHNPSTGDVIAEAPLCTAAHVNEAVEAAAAAFPAWMETPPVERARILF